MSKEKYYDDNIAPKLMSLAKECEDHGLSFVASCEWEPGKYGSTRTLRKESGFAMRMIDTAARACGNVDSFMIAIEKYAREHGHASIYLNMLGIPMEKEQESSEEDVRE